MKSHHTTTLHQFTLLSKRGVRLHLKNQTTSSRNHLKNTFWKDSSSNHLTHFGNNSLSKLHWMKISLLHNYNSTWNRRIAAFIFKTYKIIISDTLLVNGLQLCNWALYDLFFCFFYSIQCIPTSLYSGKHVYKLTTTCAKAKNDVYLCARSFSLRMSQKKTKPISIINPTSYCNLQQAQIFVKNWFHEKKICMNDEGACVS